VTVPSIRPATSADATAIATVHVAAWQAAYDGLLPADFLAAQSVERRAALWTQLLDIDGGVIVAEIDNEIVGFANVGRCRDEDALDSDGELYAIYLSPTRWSTGVGHALHEGAIGMLAEAGYSRASLWVLDNNARAIQFYERHGWRADGLTKDDERDDGVVFRERRMRRDVVPGAH
jgi:GNAT superfamily N-acetyltransferase